MRRVIEEVAQSHGVPEEEVRVEMRAAIEVVFNNPDPEVQANLIALFGHKTPTPEEFIARMASVLGDNGH